uniref:Uncharacterized protein n=1 Tax=Daphnia galeata TaxID=27404 RepID=A0A8J2RPH0_9CRUS|nr:unnamed protein product [Daphnia galeata]
MLKEANQDETLARRDQAAAAANRARRNPTRMVRYGLPPVNPATRNFEEDFHPMVRGRGRTNPGVGSMRGNPRGRYESIYKSVFPSVHNLDSKEIGARLKTFSDRWEAVTDDPWVLDTVVNGLRIDFIGKPTQRFPPQRGHDGRDADGL